MFPACEIHFPNDDYNDCYFKLLIGSNIVNIDINSGAENKSEFRILSSFQKHQGDLIFSFRNNYFRKFSPSLKTLTFTKCQSITKSISLKQ